MVTVRIPTHYYQQFHADWSRDIPAEGYGGWRVAVGFGFVYDVEDFIHATNTRG